MSAREDAMIARYHERHGTLEEYLSGKTAPAPRHLWHEDWKENPQREEKEYDRGR